MHDEKSSMLDNVTIEAFYTNTVVKGTDKTVADMNVAAVVHIDTVRIESPAADYLDILNVKDNGEALKEWAAKYYQSEILQSLEHKQSRGMHR